MRGWIEKADLLKCTNSLAIRGWIERHPNKKSIPCSVQTGPRRKHLKDGHVYCRFYPEPPMSQFEVQIPREAVVIEHKGMKHSFPLDYLPLVRMIIARNVPEDIQVMVQEAADVAVEDAPGRDSQE